MAEQGRLTSERAMKLTDYEKEMFDGVHGRAKARAMDLLVRYGEALGAERLIETNNVAGAFNASTPSVRELVKKGFDAVYSEFNLDSAEVVEVPKMVAHTCQLITGIDNANWRVQGIPDDLAEQQKRGEEFFGSRGINMFATCTPYQVGNVPVKGEHCAWMESSAVVYCNSVLGARTNTEGKESTGAAALTGRIPYWGYHIKENRRGSHLVEVDIDVDDIMDWGLLGYYLGEIVDDEIPVLTGRYQAAEPDQAQAFWRGGCLLGRRRDVPHPGHHAGGPLGRGGVRRQSCSRHRALRREGAADRLREPQLRDRAQHRFRHARLPAQLDRSGLADRLAARRPQDQRQHGALGAHAARAARGRRPQRLHEDDHGRRRPRHERHVPGDLAPHAEGDQGGGDGFGQAGALSAGDHRRVGLVRLGEGLRRRRRHRPLGRRPAMSDVAAPEKGETKIVLRGRKVVGGCAEGEAIVTRDTISGWGGINERDGTVIERRHELRGQSFKDKVLVFPGAKGSSGWSAYFHMARLNGASPRAMIFNKMTTKVALGAVVTHAPAMTELEQDPLQVIETGDWVKVDADNGIVEITKRRR